MHWNEETGVLVIGYGGAGAVCALTAHDLKANVLIVEKMEEGGGNTNISLGGFLCFKDFDGGLQYLTSLCSGIFQTVEPEMLQVFAKECLANKEWVEGLGAKTHVYGGAAFPQLPGADSVEKRMITGKNSQNENSFWSLFRTQVENRKIPVWHNAPASNLITDSQGGIIGAEIEKNGIKTTVKANNAVILSCGGFEYNDWVKMNYLKGYPYYALGSPGNTGDGLRMAQHVGADLWHMSGVSTPLGFKANAFDAAFMLYPSSNNYIFVDKNGKRFASECADVHAYNYIVDFFDTNTLEYPRIPCFVIFDEVACEAGPIAMTALGYNRGRYEWSKDNHDEVDRRWIQSDETIAGLAKKIGLNPQELDQTVKKYNSFCESGEDTDFKRPEDKLAPVVKNPYYAMKLWPCLLNTQGGPRRNHNAQVLYPDTSPIPHLYSAGELGSIFGLLYQGAGNLGECLAFGRIAGKRAAAEKRRP